MGQRRQRALLAVTLALFLAAGLVQADPPEPPTDRHGDPLPPHAVARLGTVRWRSPLRDGSGFARVCFSPDARVVASVGDTGLCLWEASGKRVPWSPDIGQPGAAVFSADGKTLLTESAGPRERDPLKMTRLLQRWEVGTGKLLSRQTVECSQPTVRFAVLSADGQVLV